MDPHRRAERRSIAYHRAIAARMANEPAILDRARARVTTWQRTGEVHARYSALWADVLPRNHPDRADLIDGSIGELSPFHETFGYYAQGVGPETATVPPGWESRLVVVRSAATRGATGLCLEVHDLALSKYVALREK